MLVKINDCRIIATVTLVRSQIDKYEMIFQDIDDTI